MSGVRAVGQELMHSLGIHEVQVFLIALLLLRRELLELLHASVRRLPQLFISS